MPEEETRSNEMIKALVLGQCNNIKHKYKVEERELRYIHAVWVRPLVNGNITFRLTENISGMRAMNTISARKCYT